LSGSTVPSSAGLWWSTRRSRVLLLAVHVPFLLVGPLTTVVGIADPPQDVWLVLALAVPVAALQVRHSLAAASGMRPSWWPGTLTALGLLAFVPLPWFGADWASVAWFFISSTAMFLTGPRRRVLTVLPILGIPIWLGITAGLETPRSVSTGVWAFLYWSVGISSGSLCLYAGTRLVRAVDELFATRAELAESVVGRERVRLSRDLHDLLGQSLSAVSLKGDLALELLRGGSAGAAAEEVRSLSELARKALHDIRHVVLDEHAVTLDTETAGAGVLLTAASIHTEVDVRVGNLPRPVDELLAWATREGVTNMLRHSQASSCTISAAHQDDAIVLEIVNDGARAPAASGSGIPGLTERAQALAGSVTAGHLADGRFRLRVQVPSAGTIT
jgi:two-component system, NarL family, sensor histidine kinase DesK